jgi:hypothetical protein
MDNSLHQLGSDTSKTSVFLASLQIVDRLLNWLTGLIKLTKEEQKDAGIYLGGQGHQ